MVKGGQRRSVNRRLEIERTRSEKKKKVVRRRKKRRSESLHIFLLCILEDNKNIKSGSTVCNELSV